MRTDLAKKSAELSTQIVVGDAARLAVAILPAPYLNKFLER